MSVAVHHRRDDRDVNAGSGARLRGGRRRPRGRSDGHGKRRLTELLAVSWRRVRAALDQGSEVLISSCEVERAVVAGLPRHRPRSSIHRLLHGAVAREGGLVATTRARVPLRVAARRPPTTPGSKGRPFEQPPLATQQAVFQVAGYAVRRWRNALRLARFAAYVSVHLY